VVNRDRAVTTPLHPSRLDFKLKVGDSKTGLYGRNFVFSGEVRPSCVSDPTPNDDDDESTSPPPPPPPSPPPPPTPTIEKDPHLHFAHGGNADFRGGAGKLYSFFSAPGFAVNLRTEEAVFSLHHGRRRPPPLRSTQPPDSPATFAFGVAAATGSP